MARLLNSGDVRMRIRQRLLIYRERSVVEGLDLGVATLIMIQAGEVVESQSDFWMFGSKGLLLDHKGTFEEGLGLGVATLGLIQAGEVVQLWAME